MSGICSLAFGATLSALARARQAARYRRSTGLYRASTAQAQGGGMFNQARAVGWLAAPAGAVTAETVDRGFDWGSAAVGAGAGAALTLLLLALGAAVRSVLRAGSRHRGERWS